MEAKALVIITLMNLLVYVSAYATGAPPAVCKLDFEVGHPNTDRSNADVSLELYKDGLAVSCFEKSQEYTMKIKMHSDDPQKNIMGVLLGYSNGKFDRQNMSDSKLKEITDCGGQDVYTHRQRLFVKELNLFYQSPKSNRKSIEFKMSVVFSYKDFIQRHITEIPPCPDPTTSSSSKTETITMTTSQITTSVFVTPTPIQCHDCTKPIDNNTCDKSVHKEYDIRTEIKDGIEYTCNSTVQLRKFTCGNCSKEIACQTDCKLKTVSFSCQPNVRYRTRTYNCKPTNTTSTAPLYQTRIRNIPIEYDCLCEPMQIQDFKHW